MKEVSLENMVVFDVLMYMRLQVLRSHSTEYIDPTHFSSTFQHFT
jgi:hypothetical protein